MAPAQRPCALHAAPQPSLALLSVPDNRLTALPAGLCEAASLTKLDAAGNALADLPGFLLAGLRRGGEGQLFHGPRVLVCWAK
jgi:hypothetical protein